MSQARTIEWMKFLVEYVGKVKNFEGNMKNIKVLSMKDGVCKSELVVSKSHLNVEGHLHPGLATTLVDVISNWALVTRGLSGVSVNIHVSFFHQPIIIGEVLSINSGKFRIQPPLAYLEVELSKKNSGDIVARGQQTLFLVPLKRPVV